MDVVLAGHGDRRTRTQPVRVRRGFTAFGQTRWALSDQVRFTSGLVCAEDGAAVVADMRAVAPGQRWGLGRIRGAAFKGGWGPDPKGRYVVRQLGVVSLDGHPVAVAVAVEPTSGSFADGTAALDRLAAWLQEALPPGAGRCPWPLPLAAAGDRCW